MNDINFVCGRHTHTHTNKIEKQYLLICWHQNKSFGCNEIGSIHCITGSAMPISICLARRYVGIPILCWVVIIIKIQIW